MEKKTEKKKKITSIKGLENHYCFVELPIVISVVIHADGSYLFLFQNLAEKNVAEWSEYKGLSNMDLKRLRYRMCAVAEVMNEASAHTERNESFETTRFTIHHSTMKYLEHFENSCIHVKKYSGEITTTVSVGYHDEFVNLPLKPDDLQRVAQMFRDILTSFDKAIEEAGVNMERIKLENDTKRY